MNAKKGKNSGSHLVWRILQWVDYVIAGALVLLVLLICGVTWWLTPSRLSEIVDKQASQRLNADVSTADIHFTFWSTFPHFCIVTDSLYVRSRTLDGLNDSIKTLLPANPDFLISAGKIEGGINIAKLLKGQIWLRDVSVDSLRLQLISVNDTLNNYDIVPEGGNSKIPYFNIDNLRISDGGQIGYYSKLSNTDAKIKLGEASLLPGKEKDQYRLMFKGNLYATAEGFALLRNFPFELDGDVRLRFSPFGITTNDYTVNFGKVKGKVGMDVDLDDQMRVNTFDYHLNDFTIDDLRMLLPDRSRDFIRNVDADLSLEASARLTSPYNFSSGLFPSLEIDFLVPDGEVGYTFADNKRYAVENVGLEGKLVYNGENPAESYLEIPRLHVDGYGTDITAHATITDITRSPRINFGLKGTGNLDETSRTIPELGRYALKGKADFNILSDFVLQDRNLKGVGLQAEVNAGDLEMNVGDYNLAFTGLKAATKERNSNGLAWDEMLEKLPLDLKVRAKDVMVSNRKRKESYEMSGLMADAVFEGMKSADVLSKFDINLKGNKIEVVSKDFSTELKNVNADFRASRLDKLSKSADYDAPALWTADAESMARVDHTAEFVKVTLPQSVRNLMARWKALLNFRSGSGNMQLEGYDVNISDLSLDATFDSINVRNAGLGHGLTKGNIKADITNLRQFLNSPSPAPLFIGAVINLDTVQVNQLARDFVSSHPSKPETPQQGIKAEKKDTLTILLPRNIFAKVHATADETRYTNLHLYNLSTDLTLADGKASVDTLNLEADFGKLGLKMMYDTSDIQDLRVSAGARLYDVDVVGFFQNFKKIQEMWPEMSNLSGNLSIGLDAHAHIFPNMFVNAPSLWANANIDGWNLQLHQNDFIRHLAHMLLIYQDEPIDIENIAFHAVIHSNLLEIFPTTFEVSKYKLVLMGLNNFNGDLYYHVGVENWPLKIPFGVNIKGNYHHPVLRFGGKSWKDRNGAMIAGGIQDTNSFNIVNVSKKYAGQFVHSAASYEGE